MNRRGFLGALTAAIGAVQSPLVARAVPIPVVSGGFTFVGPVLFDYGRQVGLAITLPDGRRHGVRTSYEYLRNKEKVPEQHIIELKRALLDWAESQYGRKAA